MITKSVVEQAVASLLDQDDLLEYEVVDLPGFVYIGCKSAASLNTIHYELLTSQVLSPSCQCATVENYRTQDFGLLVGTSK